MRLNSDRSNSIKVIRKNIVTMGKNLHPISSAPSNSKTQVTLKCTVHYKQVVLHG